MSPLPTTLQETQTLLWQLITAPDGVPDVALPVKGDDRLSARQRLDIYANMYFFRILDALKEDFPKLLEELGDQGFHNLVTEYLVAHPPTHYSLRYAGQHLAEFLSACHSERSEESQILHCVQDDTLATIARFEWALVTAFDAADALLLTEDDLGKLPTKDWPSLLLKLHPSVQLLEDDHQLVWRQGLEVVFRPATDVEWTLLSQIQSGSDFAALCETAEAGDILNLLRTWISQGLLAKSRPIQ